MNKYLLSIKYLILLLLNIKFIECQLYNLELYELNSLIDYPSNEYIGYPSSTASSSCGYNVQFYYDFVQGSYTSVQPTNGVGNITIQLSFEPNTIIAGLVNLPLNTVEYYNFQIMFDNDQTKVSKFQLRFECIGIDTDSISVSILTDQLEYFQTNKLGMYTYLLIKNLKYKSTPVITNSDVNLVSMVNNELYIILFPGDKLVPGEAITFGVRIFDLDFMLTIPPYYKSIEQTVSISTLPSTILTSTYKQPGISFCPVIIANSYSEHSQFLSAIRYDNSNRYQGVKLSSSIDGKNNVYAFAIPYSPFNISIIYSNSSRLLENNYNIQFDNPDSNFLPSIAVNQLNSEYFTITMDTDTYNANDKVFFYSYGQLGYPLGVPFGFTEGDLQKFKFSVSLKRIPKTVDYTIYEYGVGSTSSFSITGTQSTLNDNIPPTITYYNAKYINNTGHKYLITIDYQDNNAISRFHFGSVYKFESLVYGTPSQGRFEFVVSVHTSLIFFFYDVFENFVYYSTNNVIYADSNKKLQFLDLNIINNNFSISMFQDIQILELNIDVLNKPNYNMITFKSDQLSKDSGLTFGLFDDISFGSASGLLPFHYNESTQSFYCKFIVPKNIELGKLGWVISVSPQQSITSLAFNASLNVISSHFDNDGPTITFIENANTNAQQVGWIIEISDHANGFDTGYVKAIGSIDGSIYKFNFTSNDAVSGNSTKGRYELFLKMPTPSCILQDYTIAYIFLNDTNGIASYYAKDDSGLALRPYKNSLRNYMNDLSIIITTAITCNGDKTLSTPQISTISVNPNTIDVGSNNRIVNITFMVSDSVALHPYSNPIVYLTSDSTILECEAAPITPITTQATYSCEIQLPYAFGSPSNKIFYSIYGIVNTGGKFRGYSTNDLFPITNPAEIQITYNIVPILLDYDKYFSPGPLIIYGKSLDSTQYVEVHLSNGDVLNITPTIIGTTVLSITIDVETDRPFTVRSIGQDSTSTNIITITPTYFKPNNIITPTPSSTPTPTPTPTQSNKPNKCLGNPLCGGKDHGYCNADLGCICYSPWTGYDCLSSVIIVPQPPFNITDPVIEIPIDIDNSDSGSNEFPSGAVYKSLISLYGIRELDINQKPVKTFKFESWIFDQVDKYSSIYKTNILSSQNNISITATLKWYENETTIDFANTNLTMLPSSIKYTIQIQDYPFASQLNTLELIMFTSFESSKSKDICSSKDFTTSPDERSDYLKIQIENKSFYGRFIKRAIIDEYNIVPLSNRLLDKSMNTINSPNQVQSYIGISIPPFKSKAFIDPDFSIILNPSSPSSNSICTGSNKLSSTKIAGIVIGCVAFTTVITISIVYAVYKNKQNKLFKRNVENKLKNINQ